MVLIMCKKNVCTIPIGLTNVLNCILNKTYIPNFFKSEKKCTDSIHIIIFS